MQSQTLARELALLMLGQVNDRDAAGADARTRAPPDRAVLHERIALRFDQMLAGGLVDEVAALRTRGDLHLGLPSMRSVGYRQVWEHLDGQYDRDELRLRGIYATRQLAKRQLTWLRGFAGAAGDGLRWLDPADPALLSRVQALLREIT